MFYALLASKSSIGLQEFAVSCDTRLFVFHEPLEIVELHFFLVRLAAPTLELELLLRASEL